MRPRTLSERIFTKLTALMYFGVEVKTLRQQVKHKGQSQ